MFECKTIIGKEKAESFRSNVLDSKPESSRDGHEYCFQAKRFHLALSSLLLVSFEPWRLKHSFWFWTPHNLSTTREIREKFSVTMLWAWLKILKPLLTYFHGSTFFYKRRLNFIPQVINFKREVKLGSSWLNWVLFAERYPFPSKICCLNQRLKRKHRGTIIRYIARDFIHRIIQGEDRKNRVCSDQRWLL